MIKETLHTDQINTDADANIKGIGLQKLRVVERLMIALLEDKKAVFCTIEHVDDVLEVNLNMDMTNYITEQDKSYSINFSINSEQIKNSLRIFLDNWFGTVEGSESIKFVFYTNANYKKEKKVGILKTIKEELPNEPILKLLREKRYKEAFPFVVPVLKEYYITQHKRHTDKIEPYEKLIDSMDDVKWKTFFDLIEWEFGRPDEIQVRSNITTLVQELCIKYDVSEKYSDTIIARVLDMIESRQFEDDYLRKIVHVGEIKAIFLEFAQAEKVREKLDPMHAKWDSIRCDDIRCIREKFIAVCSEYDVEDMEDLEEEYIEGAYEQSKHQNLRQVKAYNYRVYKVCCKKIKKFLKSHTGNLIQNEIEELIDDLTDSAYVHIKDKAQTYNVAFEDEDMIRKTIIILFQDCYLALDGRKSING